MSEVMLKPDPINGVDIGRFAETVETIQTDPHRARFQFRTRNTWINGAHNRSSIRDFSAGGQEDQTRSVAFVMDADEPAALLGSDTGANPVECLLHALAACMTTSLVYHAAARGISIESVESRFEGHLDLHGFLGLAGDIRPGLQGIRARFKINADADAAELEELMKFSPVRNSIAQPVPLDVSVEVAPIRNRATSAGSARS